MYPFPQHVPWTLFEIEIKQYFLDITLDDPIVLGKVNQDAD